MDYLCENEECSSGCDSGWTVYLDYSSISQWNQENRYLEGRRRRRRNDDFREAKRLKEEEDDEEEDEDLSMVSDASSGPPHLPEEEADGAPNGNVAGGWFYNCSAENPTPRKKSRENRRLKAMDESSSLLDDTASSPFLDFSSKARNHQPLVENASEYSQGFSTTQFEVRPPLEEYYEFFQSSSENQVQQNQGWFEGKSYW